MLGHASPAFTVAVYQHAWQEGPSEAAAALGNALAPGVTDVGVGDVGNPLANDALQSDDERVPIAN